LKPEGCAFRIYDDPIYQTVISYNDNHESAENVQVQCISGHTGCHFEQSMFSNIGTVQECTDEQQQQKTLTNKEKIKKKRSENGIYIILGAVLILSIAILAAFYTQNYVKKIDDVIMYPPAESTPLISTNKSYS